MTTQVGAAEAYTEGSAFEGMFVRALQPEGRFAEELRAAGFDARAMRPQYPTSVWFACIEVARRHTCGELPREAGFRALGRRLGDGFLDTLVGKVIGAGLSLLGPEGTVKRLPRYFMGVSGGVHMSAERVGERRWRLDSRDAWPLPDVTAGLLEVGLARTGARVQVEVVERRPDGYALLLHW